jgi:pimeloyl-ACP methyl ester carboxylesterase
LGDDALALLRALDAQPAHVFGYSVGGQSAHIAAVKSPESFHSLILGAPDIRAQSGGGRGFVPGNVALTMLDPGYNHPSYWMHHLGMEFTFSPQFRKDHPERIQRLADTIRERQAPAKPYVRHVIARTTHSSADRLGDLRIPTLVLVGAEDREASGGGAVHVDLSRQIADQIPGARFRTVPGARHLFPWEAPEATVQALLEFLGAL